MSEGCNIEERTANISLTFDVCVDHDEGRASGAIIEVGGINPLAVVDAILGCAEQLVLRALTEEPKVLDTIRQEEEAHGFPLPEEGKENVLRELAQRLLAKRVEGGKYVKTAAAASMTMPRSD